MSKLWHNLFYAQSPDFRKRGLCFYPKFMYLIDENIASNDPVRIVNAVVDNLNLDSFRKLYKETGRCPYPPKMMLKMIIYAYMNNIYSCRKIEKLLLRDIHYMWLSVMSIRILLPSTVFVTV